VYGFIKVLDFLRMTELRFPTPISCFDLLVFPLGGPRGPHKKTAVVGCGIGIGF
jgi:hypothetical protein